ncbi:hypothetical protein Vafri_9038 [Volvox africanus]|uniref:Uncharacterized protein n=1 Tax=Volvox africanus TaxID=51714 RepID=A0A8J4B833_9CHLO|nr:hypothetical protein Vafri_9038 [Volvox africanus]
MAASAIDKQPSGVITLLTSDGGELLVDKELLCSSSKFFAGMLTACDATRLQILIVADKYDMSLVKERCEKWLVSRCLRGRMRSHTFKFQDVSEGFEWLAICQKFDLKDLGWYCAYDLGTQLAQGAWPRPLHDCLEGVTCPDMLKTILEAVQAAVNSGGPLGPSGSGAGPGGEPAGPGHGLE